MSDLEGDFFLFPTSGLTLNELREKNPDLFGQGSDPRWGNQLFANKKGEIRKLLLRTSAQPDSFGKTWDEQRNLLSEGQFIPTTRDLIEGMITYYQAIGKRLFPDYWVRSQEASSDGDRIGVRFPSDGINIDGFGWNGFRLSLLGLAVAWRDALILEPSPKAS